MRATPPFVRLVTWCISIALVLFGETDALAQTGIDPARLSLASMSSCSSLAGSLSGNESGGQWLIGSDIMFFGQSNARQAMDTRNGLFDKVSCYSRVDLGETQRVFVANEDRSLCGWVDTAQLLDPHILTEEGNRFRGPVCQTPRAMQLEKFCAPENLRYSENLIDCQGVPRGLRAKGILMGSTLETAVGTYPFMTAPSGGQELSSRLFFSVLEIHDLAGGDRNEPMALVGDGEGQMYGWIDLAAIQLWPTRLGMHYDEAGFGRMFQSQKSMILHMRNGGQTEPEIEPLLPSELRTYVHGDLPLLSYPIIRTVSPKTDPAYNEELPPFHEVIFLGTSGEGSASKLMDEAQLARKVEEINQLNVMIVIDTTESMRPYLYAVQTGISEFVRRYRARSQDASNRLSDIRIGVYAYSDFRTADATGMSDAIITEEIMPPSRIDLGFDIDSRLAAVIRHTGLNDSAGGFPEAALEAVVRLSVGFEKNPAWFKNGPRVVIHLADHGSRDTLDLKNVMARLDARKVYYVPVPIATDDRNNPKRTDAREDFVRQALTLFTPNVDGDAADKMAQIDFRAPGSVASNTVRAQIDIAMDEVLSATNTLRARVTGREASVQVRDRATSRIRISDRILESRGLDPNNIPVFEEASTGYAPDRIWRDGLSKLIDWTYTVALEPSQASRMKDQFQVMCRSVGRPDQGKKFRSLVIRLAETFSGDSIVSDMEMTAILSDLVNIPGASRSLLSQSPQVLISRADSTDQKVIDELRQDVCWVSYHLTNMGAGLYARPDQLVWTGSEFSLKSGERATGRTYLYKPIVGPDTVYLPSFFFMLSEYATNADPTPDNCFVCE